MKTKTIILITIVSTLLIAFLGFRIYNYEIGRTQDAYSEGYQIGYLKGITYTQETGNVVVVSQEGNVTEYTIAEVCNNILQQQGGGQ
jgi:hypothetical protein